MLRSTKQSQRLAVGHRKGATIVRVFLDTGVLIAAFRGKPETRNAALAVVSNPSFEFWYGPLLKLELTLQPTLEKRRIELEFFETFFRGANCYGDLNRTFEIGSQEALRHGIPVVDALHVATANLARCKFLFTTESPTKPIFRTRLVQVVSIHNPLHKRDL